LVEDREKPPVRILDKRHFDKDGERRAEDSPEAESSEQPLPTGPEGAGAERSETPSGERSAAASPEEASPFTNFILSLSSSCFMSLGQIPNPMTGSADVDLPSAGSIIDILEMLRIKTDGNLDPYENNLLDRTLGQLKMLYVQAMHKNKP